MCVKSCLFGYWLWFDRCGKEKHASLQSSFTENACFTIGMYKAILKKVTLVSAVEKVLRVL